MGTTKKHSMANNYVQWLAMGYHYCYHKIRSTVKLTEYDNYGNKILFAYRHEH